MGHSDAGGKPLPIPRYLAEAANRPDQEDLRDWVRALPKLVAELTERWSLQVGGPYDPGGQCSWVARARRSDGTEAVLKVGVRHTEAEHEADALRVWNGDGAVRLYDAYTTDRTCALLLECCDPGTPLGRAASEPEQDEVIAGLLLRLWKGMFEGHGFRPLEAMCAEWADEFEEKVERCPDRVDPGLVREALRIFRTFPGTAERRVLLCTDLHAENVLAARREPWLVIDPKPYVGDPAYDAVQHMLNCLDRVAADPHGVSERMAGLLGVEAGRVKAWLFARCMQESTGDDPWSLRLHDIAPRIAP